MRAAVAALVAIVLVLGLTAGSCGLPTPAAVPSPPWVDGPFGVRSQCDQFGHRVYSGGGYSAIAVVQDGMCPRTVR